jgi:hypothetical protein
MKMHGETIKIIKKWMIPNTIQVTSIVVAVYILKAIVD